MFTFIMQIIASTLTPEAQQMLVDIGPVKVQYVTTEHWAISTEHTARALLMQDGTQWILINSESDLTDIDQIVLHEMAHLYTWKTSGIEGDPHSNEWKRNCRRLVTRRENHFCRQ